MAIPAAVKTFIEIALLRGKPQDLPASPALLWSVVVLDVLSTYFLIDSNIAGARFYAVIVHTLVLAALLYVVLWWRDRPARFTQTATALFGGGILVTVVAWLLIVALRVPFDLENPNFLLLATFLSAWVFAIMAQILRHALEVSLGMAILITLAISFSRSALTLFLPLNQ